MQGRLSLWHTPELYYSISPVRGCRIQLANKPLVLGRHLERLFVMAGVTHATIDPFTVIIDPFTLPTSITWLKMAQQDINLTDDSRPSRARLKRIDVVSAL